MQYYPFECKTPTNEISIQNDPLANTHLLTLEEFRLDYNTMPKIVLPVEPLTLRPLKMKELLNYIARRNNNKCNYCFEYAELTNAVPFYCYNDRVRILASFQGFCSICYNIYMYVSYNEQERKTLHLFSDFNQKIKKLFNYDQSQFEEYIEHIEENPQPERCVRINNDLLIDANLI